MHGVRRGPDLPLVQDALRRFARGRRRRERFAKGLRACSPGPVRRSSGGWNPPTEPLAILDDRWVSPTYEIHLRRFWNRLSSGMLLPALRGAGALLMMGGRAGTDIRLGGWALFHAAEDHPAGAGLQDAGDGQTHGLAQVIGPLLGNNHRPIVDIPH